MIIANPIYDTVFKYLMEDNEVAKGILSAIMEEEIVELELQPQEVSLASYKDLPTVFRMDFRATIKMNSGEQKKVLIELQKARDMVDIMRFRKYLGQEYLKPDGIVEVGGVQKEIAFPIVTIYFLGFNLPEIEAPVLKVARSYYDVLNHVTLEVHNEFIEKLTHDAYVIQILRLSLTLQTKLEHILAIFNQKLVEKDVHQLDFPYDLADPVVYRCVKRLNYVASSPEMRRAIEFEGFLDWKFMEKELEKAEVEKQFRLFMETKNQEMSKIETELDSIKTEFETQKQKFETQKKELESKGKELESKEKALESKDKEIERLKKLLENNTQSIE